MQVLRESVLEFGSLEQVGQGLQVLQNIVLPTARRHVPDVGVLGIRLDARQVDRPGAEKGPNPVFGFAVHRGCPQASTPASSRIPSCRSAATLTPSPITFEGAETDALIQWSSESYSWIQLDDGPQMLIGGIPRPNESRIPQGEPDPLAPHGRLGAHNAT